ncbi:P-loop containing nucleoside triphosphate hydrolase protein [Thozetella sp. PMI_491]|nr:P-loop containing nucleoside triphosphate hydrolase protein [Thozetella sp. PMI_491]
MTGLDGAVATLCERVEGLLAQHSSTPRKRILIALAGVPGSGKTTISTALMEELQRRNMQNIMVVPMDGFHLSKAALSQLDDPGLAFRKRGAPFTFDVVSLLRLVGELSQMPVTLDGEPENVIRVPSFDHAKKDPVPDDIQVSSSVKVVIIEGNYTLLDLPPWSEISNCVDEKWFVDAPPAAAKERLVARHLQAGIESTREAAAIRAEDNDIPNGNLIRRKLIKPDVTILN